MTLRQNIAVAFGEVVAERRAQLGITQAELADLLGSNRAVVARLETGAHAPNLLTVFEYAEVLQMKVQTLVDLAVWRMEERP